MDPKYSVRHTVPSLPSAGDFTKARHLDSEKLESSRKEFVAIESAGMPLFVLHFDLTIYIFFHS